MDCGFTLQNPTIKDAINSIVGANQVLAVDVYLENTTMVDAKLKDGTTKQVIQINNDARDYIINNAKRLLNKALNEDILNTEEFKKLQEQRLKALYKALSYSTKTNKFSKPTYIDYIDYSAKKYEDLINRIIGEAFVELYSDSHSSISSLSTLKSEDSKSEKYGYANAFERKSGVHFTALRVLDIYNNIIENGNEAPSDLANTLKREIFNYWGEKLLDKIDFDSLSDEEYDKLDAFIENNDLNNIVKFADTIIDKSNIINNNLISLIKEITESEESFNAYYDEVLTDPALKQVANILARDSEYSKTKEEEIRNEEGNEDTEKESNENTSEDIDTTDEANDPDIGEGMTVYDHSGRYNNYMKHVSQRLYNFLLLFLFLILLKKMIINQIIVMVFQKL